MDDIESEEDIAADVGYGGLSLEEEDKWEGGTGVAEFFWGGLF